MTVRSKLYDYTGSYPYVVLNDLHRRKLDANRDLYEAAQGVPEMQAAWTEYHRHLYQAKASVDRGLYFDMHGHSHPTQWVELGYLISGSKLNTGDFQAENSSIRSLATQTNNSGETFEELLRGSASFGNFLDHFGYPAVPSPQHLRPDGKPFYSGGYNTREHGSLTEGAIDAIQIESPWDFRQEDHREDYADALARTMLKYLNEHYGMTYTYVDDGATQTNRPAQMVVFILSSFTLILIFIY